MNYLRASDRGVTTRSGSIITFSGTSGVLFMLAELVSILSRLPRLDLFMSKFINASDVRCYLDSAFFTVQFEQNWCIKISLHLKLFCATFLYLLSVSLGGGAS